MTDDVPKPPEKPRPSNKARVNVFLGILILALNFSAMPAIGVPTEVVSVSFQALIALALGFNASKGAQDWQRAKHEGG